MGAANISIVDYQAGNVRSVQKAIEAVGGQASITGDPEDIARSDALVFPGQGACDSSMRRLRERGLVEPIRDFIQGGRPFLGICLGLQLLLEDSDEGSESCLGVLPGRVRRLPPGTKVPHMGWNEVALRSDHPVLAGVPSGSYFYFVHSYYADPDDESVVLGTTSYGTDFCSAAAWDNVVAVQFHPEKSGDLGLRIYRQFLDLVEGGASPLRSVSV